MLKRSGNFAESSERAQVVSAALLRYEAHIDSAADRVLLWLDSQLEAKDARIRELEAKLQESKSPGLREPYENA